jgi:hypothetical protein
MLRSVKHCAVIEFLSYWNETSFAIHGKLSAFRDEISVEVKYWASLDDTIGT